jgi:hypothetical protein
MKFIASADHGNDRSGGEQKNRQSVFGSPVGHFSCSRARKRGRGLNA